MYLISLLHIYILLNSLQEKDIALFKSSQEKILSLLNCLQEKILALLKSSVK